MTASKERQWSPRDVLLAMVREIDEGTANPDALVICFKQDGNPGFMSSAPDVVTMLGLCEGAKLLIHEAAK
jgi:hypothetical protein